MLTVDDLRISSLTELTPPNAIVGAYPRSARATDTVSRGRAAVHDVLGGHHDRLVVVVGPCSIHDPEAALDYAGRLAAERARLGGSLELIMRVYFEKPRTIGGWKGLINDPDLDGSFAINKGLRVARKLLLDINEFGVPAASEFLDMTTPQYIADLVAWGAIGARTTESQVHRELSSGLSCPIGFKNGTDGNVRIAVEAVRAAALPHHFLAITKEGRAAIAATTGNEDCHIILRGGKTPNYEAESVAAACREMDRSGLDPRVMIDASHANSAKNPDNQPHVVEDVAGQVAVGDTRIMGVMIESHLVGGRQDLVPGRLLRYGQSITDGCIDWATTGPVLEGLARAVEVRRRSRPSAQSVITNAQYVL